MLLGLYGDSRSGKDSVARILSEYHKFEWRSFAAPLRQILLMINPLLGEDGNHEYFLKETVEELGWDGVKKYYPHSVDMMIGLGQGVRDLIHEDAWIWSVFTDPLPSKMVISDVRQPNEYDAIIDAGGEVWKIVRPGTVKRGMDGLLDDRYFSVVIHNTGDSSDLRRLVESELSRAENNRS